MKFHPFSISCFLIAASLLPGGVRSGQPGMNVLLSRGASLQKQETERRREQRSTLFKAYSTGKNLRATASSAQGDIEITTTVFDVGPQPPVPLGARPLYPYPLLIDLACMSDVVVVGVLKSSSSQLTMDDQFIFSDYELEVEQVIKQNLSGHIQAGSRLTVTRPGGTLVLNGRTVRVRDRVFLPFRMGGRYLLFLQELRNAGSYLAFDIGSYELRSEKVIKLSRESRWRLVEFRETPAALIHEVEEAVGRPCPEPSTTVSQNHGQPGVLEKLRVAESLQNRRTSCVDAATATLQTLSARVRRTASQ